MKLVDMIRSKPGVLAAPLVGYPTVAYIGGMVEKALKNADVQVRALTAYYKDARPDVIFPFMDLSVEAEALDLPIRFKADDSPDVTEHPLHSVDDLEGYSVPPVRI